ncbi:MAG: cytochrome c [Acidobacteriota bacterium]|nr:cytochrome c [Acidobacteriota bacterium]
MKIAQMTACLLLAGTAVMFSQEPKGSASAVDTREGAAVFESSCASCHDADSDEEKEGPPLKGVSSGRLPSGKRHPGK